MQETHSTDPAVGSVRRGSWLDRHLPGGGQPQARATGGAFGPGPLRVGERGEELIYAGSGGYVAAHQEVVDLLKQRARPYLFSNAVAPAIVAGSMRALQIARDSDEPRRLLRRNAELFRELMTQAGFELLPGEHPIVPVMFPGEDGARKATQIADAMLARGVYVIAFSFPVVPRGQARIRVQLSAAHSEEDVRACVDAFVAARDEVG